VQTKEKSKTLNDLAELNYNSDWGRPPRDEENISTPLSDELRRQLSILKSSYDERLSSYAKLNHLSQGKSAPNRISYDADNDAHSSGDEIAQLHHPGLGSSSRDRGELTMEKEMSSLKENVNSLMDALGDEKLKFETELLKWNEDARTVRESASKRDAANEKEIYCLQLRLKERDEELEREKTEKIQLLQEVEKYRRQGKGDKKGTCDEGEERSDESTDHSDSDVMYPSASRRSGHERKLAVQVKELKQEKLRLHAEIEQLAKAAKYNPVVAISEKSKQSRDNETCEDCGDDIIIQSYLCGDCSRQRSEETGKTTDGGLDGDNVARVPVFERKTNVSSQRAESLNPGVDTTSEVRDDSTKTGEERAVKSVIHGNEVERRREQERRGSHEGEKGYDYVAGETIRNNRQFTEHQSSSSSFSKSDEGEVKCIKNKHRLTDDQIPGTRHKEVKTKSSENQNPTENVKRQHKFKSELSDQNDQRQKTSVDQNKYHNPTLVQGRKHHLPRMSADTDGHRPSDPDSSHSIEKDDQEIRKRFMTYEQQLEKETNYNNDLRTEDKKNKQIGGKMRPRSDTYQIQDSGSDQILSDFADDRTSPLRRERIDGSYKAKRDNQKRNGGKIMRRSNTNQNQDSDSDGIPSVFADGRASPLRRERIDGTHETKRDNQTKNERSSQQGGMRVHPGSGSLPSSAESERSDDETRQRSEVKETRQKLLKLRENSQFENDRIKSRKSPANVRLSGDIDGNNSDRHHPAGSFEQVDGRGRTIEKIHPERLYVNGLEEEVLRLGRELYRYQNHGSTQVPGSTPDVTLNSVSSNPQYSTTFNKTQQLHVNPPEAAKETNYATRSYSSFSNIEDENRALKEDIKRLDKLVDKLAYTEKENRDLTDKLDWLKKEFEENQQKFQEVKKKFDETVRTLQSNINELVIDKRRHVSEIERLQAELDRLCDGGVGGYNGSSFEKEIGTLATHAFSVDEEKTRFKGEINQLQTDMRDLIAEKRRFEESIRGLSKEMKELEAEKFAYQEEIRKLYKSVEELRNQQNEENGIASVTAIAKEKPLFTGNSRSREEIALWDANHVRNPDVYFSTNNEGRREINAGFNSLSEDRMMLYDEKKSDKDDDVRQNTSVRLNTVPPTSSLIVDSNLSVGGDKRKTRQKNDKTSRRNCKDYSDASRSSTDTQESSSKEKERHKGTKRTQHQLPLHASRNQILLVQYENENSRLQAQLRELRREIRYIKTNDSGQENDRQKRNGEDTSESEITHSSGDGQGHSPNFIRRSSLSQINVDTDHGELNRVTNNNAESKQRHEKEKLELEKVIKDLNSRVEQLTVEKHVDLDDAKPLRSAGVELDVERQVLEKQLAGVRKKIAALQMECDEKGEAVVSMKRDFNQLLLEKQIVEVRLQDSDEDVKRLTLKNLELQNRINEVDRIGKESSISAVAVAPVKSAGEKRANRLNKELQRAIDELESTESFTAPDIAPKAPLVMMAVQQTVRLSETPSSMTVGVASRIVTTPTEGVDSSCQTDDDLYVSCHYKYLLEDGAGVVEVASQTSDFDEKQDPLCIPCTESEMSQDAGCQTEFQELGTPNQMFPDRTAGIKKPRRYVYRVSGDNQISGDSGETESEDSDEDGIVTGCSADREESRQIDTQSAQSGDKMESSLELMLREEVVQVNYKLQVKTNIPICITRK